MLPLLKQRIVGISVLVSLAAIFLPMLFDAPSPVRVDTQISVIPPKPTSEFSSSIVPLESEIKVEPVAPPLLTEDPMLTGSAALPPVPDLPPATPASGSADQPRASASPAPASAAQLTAGKTIPEKPSTEKSAPPETKSTASTGGSDQPAPPKITPPKAAAGAWVVQLAALSSAENAKSLEKKLQQKGYKAFVETLDTAGGKKYRVRVGPELERGKADAMRAQLEKDIAIKGNVMAYP